MSEVGLQRLECASFHDDYRRHRDDHRELIALRPWFPKASAVGSLGAVFMFLTTLSFIITTPGWEPSLGGFPALSGDVGEFLIKDFVLLGAALWTLADSLSAASSLPNFLHDSSNKGDCDAVLDPLVQ